MKSIKVHKKNFKVQKERKGNKGAKGGSKRHPFL